MLISFSHIKPLIGITIFFVLYGVINAQNKFGPKYLIGPGGHVNYNGRFGLVDLVAEGRVCEFGQSNLAAHVGTGVIYSFDGYQRISYLGMAGIGYAYAIKESRGIECQLNISTSNEFPFEPGMQFSYIRFSKNRSFKTRFMYRLNLIGDLDYVSPQNPLIFRDKNHPLKIYMGIGIRISRRLVI